MEFALRLAESAPSLRDDMPKAYNFRLQLCSLERETLWGLACVGVRLGRGIGTRMERKRTLRTGEQPQQLQPEHLQPEHLQIGA